MIQFSINCWHNHVAIYTNLQFRDLQWQYFIFMTQSPQIGRGHSESAGSSGAILLHESNFGTQAEKGAATRGKVFLTMEEEASRNTSRNMHYLLQFKTPFQIGGSQQCQMSEGYQAIVTLSFPPTFHWPELNAGKANISWAGRSILPLDAGGKE